MHLYQIAVGLIALFCTYSAYAQDRVVDLSVNSAALGTVIIYDSDDGLLIDIKDLPRQAVSESYWQSLPRVSTSNCAQCLRLKDLGIYREEAFDGTANLAIFTELLPKQSYNFYKPREASAEYLQKGFSFINNVFLSARDADDEDSAIAGVISSRLGLGALGVFETGLRHIENQSIQQTDRLPSLLRNHFVNQQISLELGEVRTDADPNDSNIAITGFRLFRNFATRPDITNRPLYDFFTQIERPSVIELYQNSQLQRREKVDQPGPVQLNDYRPSGSGKVLLIITDALGTQRVVETDLFLDRRNIGKGIWDFALTGGYLRGEENKIDNDSSAGSMRVDYGLTNNLTMGVFGEVAYYATDSENYRGRESIWNTGLRGLLSSRVGTFDVSVKVSNDDEKNQANSYRASWRKGSYIKNFANYAVGVARFRESEDYVTLGGQSRDIDGWRGFAGLTFNTFFVSGNIFDTGAVSGYGANAGWRWGRVSVDGSMQATDDSSPLYSVSIGYSFDGPISNLRVGARHREHENTTESFTNIRGSNTSNSVNWRAQAFHDDAFHRNRSSLSVNWQPDYLSAGYGLRNNDGKQEQFADLAFGVGFVPAKTLHIGKVVSTDQGLAVIDTQLPNIRVSVDGSSTYSNKHGLTSIPVLGFGRHFAQIDTSAISNNGIIEKTELEVSTQPGHSSRANFILNAPSAFITIAGSSPGETISVNGQVLRVYEFGAFAENLVLGANNIIHLGKRYPLHIEDFDESLPTYHLSNGIPQ